VVRLTRHAAEALLARGVLPEWVEQTLALVWFASEGARSVDTRDVAPGLMLDLDEAGNVIGVEVLRVRQRVSARRVNPA
jgi:uncharacterized protein YuzE